MAVSTGILFIRAGVGKNIYDPLYQFRVLGDSRVALALAAGIPYFDVGLGSVSESGAKAVVSGQDYNLVIHTGHGSVRATWGDYTDDYQSVISLDDADSLDLVDGRGFYAFACLTGSGSGLMESLVAGASGRTAVATAGYSGNYGFVIAGGGEDDIYFVSTMAPGFKFIESSIANKKWSVCYDDALAEFDTQIAYWDASSDPFASTVSSVLTLDKARLVKFGDDDWQVSTGAAPLPTTGTITVATNNANASWTIKNAAGGTIATGTGTSDTHTSIAPAVCTITYGAVSGFAMPASETKTLIAGATITFLGTYTPVASTGTINVTTNNAGASFALTGPASYSGTGTTYSNTTALPGLYTITFGAVAGYTTPASQTRNLVIGGSLTFTGTYVATDVVPTPVPDTEPETVRDTGLRITTIERTVQEV